MTLQGKTLFITGASRGIGLAIAKRAAADGANIVLVAKTTEPNPRLPGTLYSAAEEIEAAGGRALPVPTDIRDENAVAAAVAAGIERFGGIDILVNNASAIWLKGALETPMKRFDLMQQVNARGSFLCAQACHELRRRRLGQRPGFAGARVIEHRAVFRDDPLEQRHLREHLAQIANLATGDHQQPAPGVAAALQRIDGRGIDHAVVRERAIIVAGKGVVAHSRAP